MRTIPGRFRAGVAAIATAAIGLTALPAMAATSSSGGSDSAVLYYVDQPGTTTTDLASTLAANGLEVLSREGDSLVLLGDPSSQSKLGDLGVRTLKAESFGGSGTLRSLAVAAPQAYPVPDRLADKTYPTFFGAYRTVAGYEQFLKDVEEAYPALAQRVVYGQSWKKLRDPAQGHDLVALRITAGANSDGDWRTHANHKPRLFIVAQTHAREITASELAWRFITQLVDGYGDDADITAVLDSTEIWIVPQDNPDGIEIVEPALNAAPKKANGDGNPATNSPAWQRKSANSDGFTPPANWNTVNWSNYHAGVDLNRNWSTSWGTVGASTNPTAQTFQGIAPNSEPEVHFRAALLKQLFGAYKVGTTNAAPADRQGNFITLHSAADQVIYPYAYANAANVPNIDAIKAQGFRLSYFNRYTTGKAGQILYDNAGNDIDWVYDEIGIPAYNYEVGNSSLGSFYPGYGRQDLFWSLNGPSFLYAAKVARAPYEQPLGPSVTRVAVTRDSTGNVTVSGAASDATYGANTGSLATSIPAPAAYAVTDAEVYVGKAPWNGGVAQRVKLSGTGTTVDFSGVISAGADQFSRQLIWVRAKNASGHWGPTTSAWVQPLAAGPGNAYEVITADVKAGALSLESLGAGVTLPSTTLTGRDQVVEGNLNPLTVLDARGSGAGWSLTGQSSDFVASGGGLILANNLGWAPTASAEAGSLPVPSGQASSVVAGAVALPGAGLGSPKALATSAQGQSAGAFTAGARLSLGIPGASAAGVYVGVLTLTLV